MVDTPWGQSESLRERRLKPGPGSDPEEVARNQRTRLFGAIVASVAERGYAATRLSDLTEISGVSGNSFYNLFADKEACFIAATEALMDGALAALEVPGGTWEQQVRGAADAFAEIFVAQSAAARMCLLEAHAAGPAGLAPFERATERFEAIGRRVAVASPEMAGTPPELIAALTGAISEIGRARLRAGTESELPKEVDAFVELALGYRPPPEPLRLNARPPAAAPETIEAHDHAERVLRALAMVSAEKGYAATTVTEVINRASMSPTTFYAHFVDKDDAMLAAIESAGAQLVAAIVPAFRRSGDWVQGVRAAFGAFFNFLASRPSLAHLLMVEVYAAGPAALARRDDALRPLEVLLAEGRARSPRVPAIAREAIPGGIFALAYKQIRREGARSLPSLAPICTYFTLSPFVGPEEACAAANGSGRGRGEPRSDLSERLLPRAIGLILQDHEAGLDEIAAELERGHEEIRRGLDELEQARIIEPVDEADRAGAYRVTRRSIEDAEWRQMSLLERQRASRPVVRLITADLDLSEQSGLLDARLDRHLTHLRVNLDQEGWTELMKAEDDAFRAALRIQREAARRLLDSDAESIEGTAFNGLFEVPASEADSALPEGDG